LFYRLNVVPIVVPPLRERRVDIPLLAQHVMQIYGDKNGEPVSCITRRALDLLGAYASPASGRALENAIERTGVLSREAVLDESDLPAEVRAAGGRAADGPVLSFPVGTRLDEIEMRVIRATLERTGGDKRLAAQLLGIATRTIYRRL